MPVNSNPVPVYWERLGLRHWFFTRWMSCQPPSICYCRILINEEQRRLTGATEPWITGSFENTIQSKSVTKMFDLQCQLHITTVPELCQKLPSQHFREPNGCVGWVISGTFSFPITVCQTCLVSHPPRTQILEAYLLSRVVQQRRICPSEF